VAGEPLSLDQLRPGGDLVTLDAILKQTVQLAVEEAVRPLREELASLREKVAPVTPRADAALLTTSEAAALMGVKPATIREWVAAGKLTAHGTSRALRIARAELLALRPDRSGATVVDLQARAAAILERDARRG